MAVAKIYNDSTSQWEPAIIGAQGPQGETGPQGPAGNDGALSPNYIINGAFDIWQRGDSFTETGSFFDYTADRVKFFQQAGTGIQTKETFTPGEIEAIGFGDAQYYLRTEKTVSDTTFFIPASFILED